jgi:type II secretory pathway component GspD/PulD (secretin)
MSHRLLVSGLVALALAVPATAQERSAEQKRGAYVLKHGSAKELAPVLARYFKGNADIQTGPDGSGNCLLINAPPAVFDEILKTLDLLDRKAQSVAVEVFVIELPKKADDKEPRLDEKEFNGTLEEVAKNLDALRRKGQVAGVKRIQITAQEGQPASLTLGENKPFTTGASVTATGIATRSIAYRNTGTVVRVTPQVAADNTVTLDLRVEDSRMNTPEDGVAIGNDGKGNAIYATEFLLTSLNSKVSVASGKAVVAKDAGGSDKAGPGQVLIVVGARVVEPDGKGK